MSFDSWGEDTFIPIRQKDSRPAPKKDEKMKKVTNDTNPECEKDELVNKFPKEKDEERKQKIVLLQKIRNTKNKKCLIRIQYF